MIAVRTDVGKPRTSKNLSPRPGRLRRPLDFLFNNAGFGAPPVPMEELP